MMFYERDGEYFDSGFDEVVKNINLGKLEHVGAVSVDGDPLTGSYDVYQNTIRNIFNVIRIGV